MRRPQNKNMANHQKFKKKKTKKNKKFPKSIHVDNRRKNKKNRN